MLTWDEYMLGVVLDENGVDQRGLDHIDRLGEFDALRERAESRAQHTRQLAEKRAARPIARKYNRPRKYCRFPRTP